MISIEAKTRLSKRGKRCQMDLRRPRSSRRRVLVAVTTLDRHDTQGRRIDAQLAPTGDDVHLRWIVARLGDCLDQHDHLPPRCLIPDPAIGLQHPERSFVGYIDQTRAN
jgi:hypothetical protein